MIDFKPESKIANKLSHQLNMGGRVTAYDLFIMIISVVILLLSGCAPNMKLLNEVSNKIQKAEEYYKTVEGLEADKKYSDSFTTAKLELNRAQSYFTRKKAKKASQAAANSMTASQKILKRYYLDEIAPQADELVKDIGEKIGDDTDNPLNEYVPELNAMLDYGKKLETDQETALLDEFLKKQDKIKTIQRSKDTLTSKKLNADVSFKPGKYNLSAKGKGIIKKEVIKNIITDKNRYRKKYPQSTITMKIEIKGYTDRIGFNEKKPLFKKLIKSVKAQLPPKNKPKKRRQFLNQRLSELRAKSISDYIVLQLSDYHKNDSNFKIDPNPVGMGEILPSGVKPLKSSSDPKRRICKIYFYIALISN
ncbi:hypothetical protein QUF75_08630 [Desulfococcaceae bacterium HSG7]|nr:hypothetical protein [Desulfococcaceae bacterium HSG7]